MKNWKRYTFGDFFTAQTSIKFIGLSIFFVFFISTIGYTQQVTNNEKLYQGIEYLKQREYVMAVEIFTELIENDPTLMAGAPLSHRADAYTNMGFLELAIADYTEMIKRISSFSSLTPGVGFSKMISDAYLKRGL
jgi:tetratricopeptide (TPR) repeat protein